MHIRMKLLTVYPLVLCSTLLFPSDSSNDVYKSATIALAVIAVVAIVIIILLVVHIVKRTPTNGLYIVLA